jgi:hypothetical protein
VNRGSPFPECHWLQDEAVFIDEPEPGERLREGSASCVRLRRGLRHAAPGPVDVGGRGGLCEDGALRAPPGGAEAKRPAYSQHDRRRDRGCLFEADVFEVDVVAVGGDALSGQQTRGHDAEAEVSRRVAASALAVVAIPPAKKQSSQSQSSSRPADSAAAANAASASGGRSAVKMIPSLVTRPRRSGCCLAHVHFGRIFRLAWRATTRRVEREAPSARGSRRPS